MMLDASQELFFFEFYICSNYRSFQRGGLNLLMKNSQTVIEASGFSAFVLCTKASACEEIGNSCLFDCGFLPVWLSADVRWQVKNEASALWKICFWIRMLEKTKILPNNQIYKDVDLASPGAPLNVLKKTAASKQNTSKRGEIFIAIVKKDCVDAAFCIWRDRSCWEYPYLLCEWVYGSESPLFLFIVKRSHHLCHSSQHSSISFKTGVNNPAYCAE